MGKTYRGHERNQLKKKISNKRFRKVVPIWGRSVDKAKYVRTLEVNAEKRGRTLDTKYLVMCYGKVRYAHEAEANSHSLDGVTIPYKCNYCVHWHIGRRPPNDPLVNGYSWHGPRVPKGYLKETTE